MLEVRYIVNGEATKSVQEISTFGYRGLNLTFFRNEDGNMKVARKIGRGEMQEISTRDSIEPLKTLDDILKEKSASVKEGYNATMPT